MEPMQPGGRAYRLTIRLADLARLSDGLRGLTFEECEIQGPAIIALQGSTALNGCSFDGDAQSLFWDTGEREYVVGAIALVDCNFMKCRFERVGIAVPPDARDKFKQGFGL